MYPPAHLHTVRQTALCTNCITLCYTAQSPNALYMYYMCQSSAAAALLLPVRCSCCFDNINGSLRDPVIQQYHLVSRPTEARVPHTMMGSDSSLRPLEEAAAAALPPKAEAAAAAVADPTSPPYWPPEVAAAAALASPLLKPCDLACNIITAVENFHGIRDALHGGRAKLRMK